MRYGALERSARALPCLGMVLLLAAGTSAARQQEPGPSQPEALPVGGSLPSGFTLQSIDGDAYELPATGVGHPVVLVFFRGTW